jgi:hypothetical protein
MTCSIVKWLFKAGMQKAQNRASTELIKATCCIDRLKTAIGAEELSNFLSIKC